MTSATDNRTTELLREFAESAIRCNQYGTLYADEERIAEYAERIEQAIAATLGGGKLTAEFVEKVVNRNCEWYEGGEIDAQAIADELNAELVSGTCRIVKTWSDSDYVDDWRYRCSECGCNIPVNERDPETGDVINAANYCPNCGKRVSA